MTLELGAGLLALVSLLVTVPVTLRAHATGATHATLARFAILVGYGTLASVFSVDALVQQSLPPTLQFTRGFAAGIGVGLVLAGVAVAIYGMVMAPRTGKRRP